jgi:hypothetical protein
MKAKFFTAEKNQRKIRRSAEFFSAFLCAKLCVLLRLNLFFLLVFLSSCEKEITVNLPDAEKKVVVEGAIEQSGQPYVLLTRSSSYFAPIADFTNNLFVTDAIVVISNGVITDTMQGGLNMEIYNPFPVFAYTSDLITGEIGGTYSLKIIADGKTLTTTTTIPVPVVLDSLWVKPKAGSNNDSLVNVWAKLSDPAAIGNNYRWFTKVLGRDSRYLTPGDAAFNDKFTNGVQYDFWYHHPDDPFINTDTMEHNHRFFKGDTVVVKFCSIDFASYNFFHSLETVDDANGNPFAAPASVFTNVSESGLGGWIGYGAFYDTIIVK